MTIFSLQASPRDARSWLQLAQRCEESGFDALLAADHPGSSASPFVALAAAAAVTSTLGLGSYVSNTGVREPVLLAADVATLDVVSDGRARLGLGAGHTPAEWGAVGRVRPDVAGRVRRRIAVAEAVRALLAGEDVDVNTPDLVAQAARLSAPRRRASVKDVRDLALGMPHVTVEYGTGENPVYQVGRKSFVFFRNPRPDAADTQTGERYLDVIVFWVPSEADKQALVRDEATPFFTTKHFNGHPSVLLRAGRISELTRQELAELIQDAWLSRVSARRAATWLSAHALK